MDQMSHKKLLSHNHDCLEMGGGCYVPLHRHSFEIICRGWKVRLADNIMHSFYK